MLSVRFSFKCFNRKLSTRIEHIKVYNSLTKQKEPLRLNNNNILYWYSCGPTVYDSAHIGHASSYVSFDIIKRILSNYFHINVVNLMNITDIDDKIIKKSIQQNKSFNEVSAYYEKEFLEDLSNLNCIKPSIILRVTQHIPEIVQFIKKLVDNKLAYSTKSGSVYFNTQKFKIKSFFIIPENNDDEKDIEKSNVADFALWKARKEETEPSWPSPWGNGRPGWHIECSTLASIGFGKDLDFHSGGKDLVFPHHHNELTQCCAYYSKNQWSSFWLHSGHLHLKNDVKMSKSLSNTISIREFLKSYNSNQFRYFCLLSPYRNDKEFNEEIMRKAVNISDSFASFLSMCRNYCDKRLEMPKLNLDETEIFSKLAQAKEKIHDALCDDFNTCLVVNELYELTNSINRKFQLILDPNLIKQHSNSRAQVDTDDLNRHYGCLMSVCNFLESTLDLFGIQLTTNSNKSMSSARTDSIVDISLNFRNNVRNLILNNKEIKIDPNVKAILLKYCDQFRDELKKENIEFKDFKGKSTWQYKTQ